MVVLAAKLTRTEPQAITNRPPLATSRSSRPASRRWPHRSLRRARRHRAQRRRSAGARPAPIPRAPATHGAGSRGSLDAGDDGGQPRIVHRHQYGSLVSATVPPVADHREPVAVGQRAKCLAGQIAGLQKHHAGADAGGGLQADAQSGAAALRSEGVLADPVLSSAGGQTGAKRRDCCGPRTGGGEPLRAASPGGPPDTPPPGDRRARVRRCDRT